MTTSSNLNYGVEDPAACQGSDRVICRMSANPIRQNSPVSSSADWFVVGDRHTSSARVGVVATQNSFNDYYTLCLIMNFNLSVCRQYRIRDSRPTTLVLASVLI